MSSRTRAALLGVLVVLLVAGPVVGGVATPALATPAPTTPSASAPAAADTPTAAPLDAAVTAPVAQTRPVQVGLAPNEETLRVTLRSGGNARWTIRSNYSLADDADREAFRDLAGEYTAGAFQTQRLAAFRTATDRAGEATGRRMAIRNVQRTTNVTNGTGQLVLQFTWTNFSRQSGDRLYADDVFNTSGRTWLPGLEPYQQLVIEPPPGYNIVQATPAGYTLSDGTVRWEGPREFQPGNLSASYRRVEGPESGFPLTLVGLVAGGLGVVALAAYAVTRRGGVSLPAGDADGDGETAVTDGASAEPAAGTGSASPTDDGETAAADDEAVDTELLSDEERIERLLEENGGRMKQATIVKETEWSNAKVSQLLSAMDEAGRIDKLRIGRENLISFPDEDVTDLDEK
jgi:hypothetical protein